MQRLVALFFEMFKISLMTLGGGYAIIAVADDICSRRCGWTEEGELVEKLSLFQTIPGILAGHCAVYVGLKVAGIAGAAVALAGVVLPSLIIFSLVSVGYAAIPLSNPFLDAAFSGLRAAMAGVLAAMVVRGWKGSIRGVYGHTAVAAGCAALACGLNPALVLVGAMAAGVVREWASGVRRFPALSPIPFVFLKYGILAFGGGYVLVPFYMSDFVGSAAPFLQLPPPDFANLVALTQMTPGPIGINAATFFGYRLGGLVGACAATASLVLPGALLMVAAVRSLERFSGNRFVRAVLAGVKPVTLSLLIGAAGSFASLSFVRIEGGVSGFDFSALAIAAAAGFLVATRRLGVLAVIFFAAILSAALNIGALMENVIWYNISHVHHVS